VEFRVCHGLKSLDRRKFPVCTSYSDKPPFPISDATGFMIGVLGVAVGDNVTAIQEICFIYLWDGCQIWLYRLDGNVAYCMQLQWWPHYWWRQFWCVFMGSRKVCDEASEIWRSRVYDVNIQLALAGTDSSNSCLEMQRNQCESRGAQICGVATCSGMLKPRNCPFHITVAL